MHRAEPLTCPWWAWLPGWCPIRAWICERGHRQRDGVFQRPVCGVGQSGDLEYENYFKWMQEKVSRPLCHVPGLCARASRKIYAGADIFLMPSKSGALRPLPDDRPALWDYSVVRETGGLERSITDSGDGQGQWLHFQKPTTPATYSIPCTGPFTPTTR